jgi:hypothetical protein
MVSNDFSVVSASYDPFSGPRVYPEYLPSNLFPKNKYIQHSSNTDNTFIGLEE